MKIKKTSIRIIKKTPTVCSWESYKLREKLGDYIWKLTIGDADNHPSVPHAHAVGAKGEKLDVWTGEIYHKGSERKKTGKKLGTKYLNENPNPPAMLGRIV